MVRNMPSNAGDAGSIPSQGTNTQHAAGQLSLCATESPHIKTTKHVYHNY